MGKNKEKKKRQIPFWITIFIIICADWIWQWFKYSTADNNSLMWIGIISLIFAFMTGHADGREETKKQLEAKYDNIMLENHLLDRENKILIERIRELSK